MSIVLEEEHHTTLNRVIGSIEGDTHQPLVIFIGGIHGNEPSGVLALQHVFAEIEKEKTKLEGTMIGLVGNMAALKERKRFIEADLNRIWNENAVQNGNDASERDSESSELKELWKSIKSRLEAHQNDQICIFDLHTTSADSVPFITINDTLSNRKIASQIPVPTIFGIEEFLQGPLLSYINEIGYNALGFEAGQHDAEESYQNHVAFIWLSLAVKGLLPNSHPKVMEGKKKLLQASKEHREFFEIIYRHHIENTDEFHMKKGYTNFQEIRVGDLLADHGKRVIRSEWDARIFMPLYQNQGNDGFFIIRPIKKWILWVSRYLRIYELERLLFLLPGISRVEGKNHIIRVDLNIAKFKSRELFHLLGYRQKIYTKDSITFIRREKQ
jgi:succinylglutamate desuccinylase